MKNEKYKQMNNNKNLTIRNEQAFKNDNQHTKQGK